MWACCAPPAGITKTIIEGNRIFEEFKGAMTEQYVLQELMQIKGWNGEYYWASESKAEVDLITDGYEVYPLEVKAGMNVKARSLMTYMDKYAPKRLLEPACYPTHTMAALQTCHCICCSPFANWGWKNNC